MSFLTQLSFASPAALAALALLPALWLLFRATPPSPRRAVFPPYLLLKSLKPTNETPQRTPPILLLLRSAVVAAAILGLSGPALNAPPATGGGKPLLLVVDDSFAAAPDWRRRVEALARAVDEADRGRRSVFVLTTADPRREGLVGPLAPADARARLGALEPTPLRADRQAAAATLAGAEAAQRTRGRAFDVRWYADGVAGAGDADFVAALAALGGVTAYVDEDAQRFVVRSPSRPSGAYRIERLGAAPFEGRLAAFGRDGRALASAPVRLDAGVAATTVAMAMPLSARNALSFVALDGVRSAGAVALADARDRRALVGLVAGGRDAGDALLSGAHYIKKALAPYAEFTQGSIDAVLKAGASVVVLDDVGRLRPSDAEALSTFANKGGVVIRFAGDSLAAAVDGEDAALLPVRLRGGRAVGGALSWETPQALGPYAADGPFAALKPPSDAVVRRQVLAEPGGEASERTWASLEDGTPLVTGRALGEGAVALFHVTATPDWSDLPMTDAFVDMLRSLIALAALGPSRAERGADERLQAARVLDGYGRLVRPAAGLAPLRLADAPRGPTPQTPPGLYGADDAPVALNALPPDAAWRPLDVSGLSAASYEGPAPMRLAGPFFAVALALLAIDALLTLALSGRLRRAATAALVAACVAGVLTGGGGKAAAQPLDRPLSESAVDAALRTRLAYVRTGDVAVDSVSERGLAALGETLARRTSLEPAPPAAVDPDTDDLSVYPFLYWPVVAGSPPPGDAALANVENFMRFGGLVVFDTGDDERAVEGVVTPEQEALRAVLARLDAPPLSPLPQDHVLKRSFYLLQDLPGRTALNPVWVQKISGANDDVTPLIIGGRDWAAAWAAAKPLAGGADARELALRAGVNMVMVAFTGNYKSDQVHTTALLKRLQQR